jgi:hypothetical protein
MDAIFGDLKQVLAVECRSCMRSDINRAQHFPARRIEGVQLVSESADVRSEKRISTSNRRGWRARATLVFVFATMAPYTGWV